MIGFKDTGAKLDGLFKKILQQQFMKLKNSILGMLETLLNGGPFKTDGS